MPGPSLDFFAILEALAARKVDFVIIGGVGAVIHGAPVTTFDVDIVHSRQPENVTRLLDALHDLNAVYREQPEKRLMPTASDLSGPGHHLLMTRAGPLDLLGEVTGGRGYDALLTHSTEIEIAATIRVRLLDLPMLIALKEELARDKDVAMLAVLRRTLDEQKRQTKKH